MHGGKEPLLVEGRDESQGPSGADEHERPAPVPAERPESQHHLLHPRAAQPEHAGSRDKGDPGEHDPTRNRLEVVPQSQTHRRCRPQADLEDDAVPRIVHDPVGDGHARHGQVAEHEPEGHETEVARELRPGIHTPRGHGLRPAQDHEQTKHEQEERRQYPRDRIRPCGPKPSSFRGSGCRRDLAVAPAQRLRGSSRPARLSAPDRREETKAIPVGQLGVEGTVQTVDHHDVDFRDVEPFSFDHLPNRQARKRFKLELLAPGTDRIGSVANKRTSIIVVKPLLECLRSGAWKDQPVESTTRRRYSVLRSR